MGSKVLFETGLTDTSATDIEGAGTERTDSKGRRYRWVKNASAPTARVGAPACYDMGNGEAADFVDEVMSDVAAEDINLFAGIFLSAIANGEDGWIQTWGRYATARVGIGTTAGTIAVGDQLFPYASTDAGDTTGTGAVKAMAFILGADISVAATTSQDTVQKFIIPHVIPLVEVDVNIDTDTTAPDTVSVFIKGLM